MLHCLSADQCRVCFKHAHTAEVKTADFSHTNTPSQDATDTSHTDRCAQLESTRKMKVCIAVSITTFHQRLLSLSFTASLSTFTAAQTPPLLSFTGSFHTPLLIWLIILLLVLFSASSSHLSQLTCSFHTSRVQSQCQYKACLPAVNLPFYPSISLPSLPLHLNYLPFLFTLSFLSLHLILGFL